MISANACRTRLTKEDTAAHGGGSGSESHYEGDEPFKPVAVVVRVLNFSYQCEPP